MGRYFIRGGMFYLFLGILLSSLKLADALFGLNPYPFTLQEAIFEALVIGWAVQVMMGLVLDRRPYMAPLAGWVLLLLNAGLLISLLADPLLTIYDHSFLAVIVFAGGILQLIAIILFILDAWPRT